MEPIAKEMECQVDKQVQRTWTNTYCFVGKGETQRNLVTTKRMCWNHESPLWKIGAWSIKWGRKVLYLKTDSLFMDAGHVKDAKGDK